MLVGLCGKSGCGKDTVADFIVKEYKFTKRSMATPLKNSIKELFCLTDDQLYDPKLKNVVIPKWNKSPRDLCQILGTDMLRNKFDEDIFTKNMEAFIIENEINIIIPDVRFQNEINLIKKYGGTVWNIDRNQKLEDYHLHESECQILNADEIIYNNKSIDDLHNKIKSLMNKY